MNARDYLKIMQRERPEESQAVMLPLEEAKKFKSRLSHFKYISTDRLKKAARYCWTTCRNWKLTKIFILITLWK